MLIKKLCLFAVLGLISLAPANAQILTPVSWKFESEELGNQEYLLKFIANIDEGWTVYSQHTSDDGPVPTEIVYENAEGVEFLGESSEHGNKKEGFDKIFEVDVIKYLADRPFEIHQKIKVTDATKPFSGYLTFMTCDKTRCLPPTDEEFSFSFQGSSNEQKAELVEKPQSSNEAKSSIEEKSTVASLSEKLETQINSTTNESKESKTDKKSNILEPVTWSFNVETLGNDEYNLVYTADIDDAWTVYSQFTSDDGPVPTSINYDEMEGVELLGKAEEIGHKKEGPDPLFDDVQVIKYLGDEDFIIKQKVKLNDKSKNLQGYLTYMTCDKTRCLPPTDVDFKFDMNALKGMAIDPSALNADTGMAIASTAGGQWPEMGEPVSDCIEAIDTSSLFWTFLQGLGFGLLALLTPCVFPMIPLTVSFFTKKSSDSGKKSNGMFNAIMYGVSIFAIYLLVSVPFWVANIPTDTLNVISTDVWLNLIFFAVFLFFAFSFFGFYELTLPSKWANKTDKLSGVGGFLGIFFMALTLVIVSFSCTGPLLGVVLAQTISGGNAALTSALAGFGLALGAPFALFAMFPSWMEKLPKSGGWLNTVKVVLGFIELGLALKFLSNADLVSQWGFLKREIFLGLWVILGAATVLYLMGYIRFPHDGPRQKISTSRWVVIGIFALFTAYLVPGLFGKNLSLLSGFPPPMHYSIIHHEDDKLSKLDIFKDYEEGMAYAKEVNKPVMLDFTGWACVNCRKMEENVWIKDEIYNKLKEEYVIISLYVDEKTKLEEGDQYISPISNKKIRTIGNLWSDFEVTSFMNNSQPLYALLTPDQKLLNNAVGYTPNVTDYSNFLDCGIEAFKEGK